MKRDGEVLDAQFFAWLLELASLSGLGVGREKTGRVVKKLPHQTAANFLVVLRVRPVISQISVAAGQRGFACSTLAICLDFPVLHDRNWTENRTGHCVTSR